MDATSRRDFRAPFAAQIAHNTTFVPYPNPLHPPHGVGAADLLGHVLARVEEALAHPAMGGVPVGAVLVEPIQGRGGSVVPPAGLLAGLRALCDRHGALLICDEIFTGLCRTGTWFACETEDVVPDLLCVGKALGGGFPVSACLGRPHVMAAWGESTGEALHTSTFLGHPVAAAAALETLAILRDEATDQRAAELGAWLLDVLRDGLADHPSVAEVRGRGLMIGIELRDGAVPARDVVWQAVLEALRAGVLLLPCGVRGEVLQLTPPACLTPAQRDVLVETVVWAIEAASGAAGHATP